MEQTQQQIAPVGGGLPAVPEGFRDEFLVACEQAGELQLADGMEYTFKAAVVVNTLRNLLTKEIVETYFVPLMGTRVGFLTDRDKPRKDKNGNFVRQDPYDWMTVRDCIIDGACLGLAPIRNQINIISASMYPTKEGFSHLLKKIGCKYFIYTSEDKYPPQAQTAMIECRVNYEYRGEKNEFTYKATPKKDAYSSLDQLKGKAERKAKKALYEYLTGTDLGDADEDSGAADYQPQPEDKVQALRDRKANGTATEPKLM